MDRRSVVIVAIPNDFRLIFKTSRVTGYKGISKIVTVNYIVHNSAPRFSCVYRKTARKLTRLGAAKSIPIVCNLLAYGGLRRTRSHTNNVLNGGNSRYTIATVGVMSCCHGLGN